MSNDKEFHNIITNLNMHIKKEKIYTPSKTINFELINQNQISQNITVSMKRKNLLFKLSNFKVNLNFPRKKILSYTF